MGKAPISSSGFWRLLIGTVTMLAFGYAGESGAMNAWIGFFFGMCGWGFILYEIFGGESGSVRKVLRCRQAVVQQHAHHRERGMVYLPSWLLPRPGEQDSRCSPSPQRDLQHCRFREQDRLCAGMLVVRQG